MPADDPNAMDSRAKDALADARPLAGKKVLVLRPEHQCRSTAELLRARGAIPVAFAAIAIEPPDDPTVVSDALARLSEYDLVVLTSENGVDALFEAMSRDHVEPSVLASRLTAAIGPGTARALQQRGICPSIVPERFVAEALADAIAAALGPRLAGARILLARALEAREVLPETLRGLGAIVDVVPIYRTVPADARRAPELRALLIDGDIGAVLVTSSSTIESVCRLLGEDAPVLLARTCLASIGPVTTATAHRHGLRVDVNAESSTLPALIEALERHLLGDTGSGSGRMDEHGPEEGGAQKK